VRVGTLGLHRLDEALDSAMSSGSRSQRSFRPRVEAAIDDVGQVPLKRDPPPPTTARAGTGAPGRVALPREVERERLPAGPREAARDVQALAQQASQALGVLVVGLAPPPGRPRGEARGGHQAGDAVPSIVRALSERGHPPGDGVGVASARQRTTLSTAASLSAGPPARAGRPWTPSQPSGGAGTTCVGAEPGELRGRPRGLAGTSCCFSTAQGSRRRRAGRPSR
jgi:hypothetical protein